MELLQWRYFFVFKDWPVGVGSCRNCPELVFGFASSNSGFNCSGTIQFARTEVSIVIKMFCDEKPANMSAVFKENCFPHFLNNSASDGPSRSITMKSWLE